MYLYLLPFILCGGIYYQMSYLVGRPLFFSVKAGR